GHTCSRSVLRSFLFFSRWPRGRSTATPLCRLSPESLTTNSVWARARSIRQGRKSLRLCLAELRIRRFDTIAEASELPDHLRRALLLRLFGNRGAPFFVTNSLVQD